MRGNRVYNNNRLSLQDVNKDKKENTLHTNPYSNYQED